MLPLWRKSQAGFARLSCDLVRLVTRGASPTIGRRKVTDMQLEATQRSMTYQCERPPCRAGFPRLVTGLAADIGALSTPRVAQISLICQRKLPFP